MECRWGSRWFVGMSDASPPGSLEFRSANARSVCRREGTLPTLAPFPFRSDSKRPGVNLPWKARGTQAGSRLKVSSRLSTNSHHSSLLFNSNIQTQWKKGSVEGRQCKSISRQGKGPSPLTSTLWEAPWHQSKSLVSGARQPWNQIQTCDPG